MCAGAGAQGWRPRSYSGTRMGIRQLPGGGELRHCPLQSLRVFPTAVPMPPSFLITISSLEDRCLTCAI